MLIIRQIYLIFVILINIQEKNIYQEKMLKKTKFSLKKINENINYLKKQMICIVGIILIIDDLSLII